MRPLLVVVRHASVPVDTGSPLTESALAEIGWEEPKSTELECLKLEWSVVVSHERACVTAHMRGTIFGDSVAGLKAVAEREVFPALERCKRRVLAAAEVL